VNKRYVVVEDAGGDNQTEVGEFKTYEEALAWCDSQYGNLELDERLALSVDVMLRREDGSLTTEL
jgi:hypothetical protein